MRLWFLSICSVLFGSAVMAAEKSAMALFAEAQEAEIHAKVAAETLPLRRIQMEYLLRQGYALRLGQEEARAIRSGQLTTPEVEALRKERAALLAQVEALDRQIAEASRKAPEMVELRALAEANEKRLDELRSVLAPPAAAARAADGPR